jgi:hypothetical protein
VRSRRSRQPSCNSKPTGFLADLPQPAASGIWPHSARTRAGSSPVSRITCHPPGLDDQTYNHGPPIPAQTDRCRGSRTQPAPNALRSSRLVDSASDRRGPRSVVAGEFRSRSPRAIRPFRHRARTTSRVRERARRRGARLASCYPRTKRRRSRGRYALIRINGRDHVTSIGMGVVQHELEARTR